MGLAGDGGGPLKDGEGSHEVELSTLENRPLQEGRAASWLRGFVEAAWSHRTFEAPGNHSGSSSRRSRYHHQSGRSGSLLARLGSDGLCKGSASVTPARSDNGLCGFFLTCPLAIGRRPIPRQFIENVQGSVARASARIALLGSKATCSSDGTPK